MRTRQEPDHATQPESFGEPLRARRISAVTQSRTKWVPAGKGLATPPSAAGDLGSVVAARLLRKQDCLATKRYHFLHSCNVSRDIQQKQMCDMIIRVAAARVAPNKRELGALLAEPRLLHVRRHPYDLVRPQRVDSPTVRQTRLSARSTTIRSFRSIVMVRARIATPIPGATSSHCENECGK